MSSSGKCASDGKSQPTCTGKKMYPIRSKLKEACVVRVFPPKRTSPENFAERDCSRSLISSVFLQDSSLLLEQPLKEHRRARERGKSRRQNGNVLDLTGNVQPAEQLQKVNDVPEEAAQRKVSRRKAEVEEQKSEDASGCKRVRLGQMSHTPPPITPQDPNAEPAARGAEEVIDVETLSPSGAEGSQEDEPERSENSPREPENHSCEEIIVVDGDEEDEDIELLGGSSLAAHQTSIPWSESLKYQDEEEEEEEEEIDVVGEQSLQPCLCSS